MAHTSALDERRRTSTAVTPAQRPPHEPLAARAAAVGNAQFAREVDRTPAPVAGPSLARAPRPKPPAPAPTPSVDASADLAFALKYVDDYYERVRDVINLKGHVQQQAIENYKAFGKLKDPPSIADAVFAEIFSQVIGFVPGGKFVQAAIGAGVFAGQLARMHKDLSEMREFTGIDPDKEVEAERQQGLGEASKKKIEKGVEIGKTAIGSGKAVVDAGLKAAQERAAATAAEAEAKESAVMQGGRISDWRQATQLAQAQELAITAGLELASRKGLGKGQLKAVVVRLLGPQPSLTEQMQNELTSKYELELYKRSLTLVTVRTRMIGPGGRSDGTSTETRLEGPDGSEVSGPTRSRIAELMRNPILAMWPETLAKFLGVGTTTREKVEKTFSLEGTYNKL